MGTGRTRGKARAHCKKKGFKKYVLSTKHRGKDLDQIQDEIRKITGTEATALDIKAEGSVETKIPYDEDLPGGGQFYCVETGKHFIDANALAAHKKTKVYKKRLKELKEKQYTQHEADFGAGITKEKLPPAHAART